MTIHEYGKENSKVVVLIHPSLVMWDYFEFVIPLLEKDYRLIIPALPGYDKEHPDDFTSIEAISAELEKNLKERGIEEIQCIYGCSMGGSIVTRFLADSQIKVHTAAIDGGITPYNLPYPVTRLIAARDFMMIYSGKLGGLKLLEKVFSTDEYSDDDLKYIAGVLDFISSKTIWRTFESCNNYSMPKKIKTGFERIEYWYSSAEKKARKWDIEYFKKNFPQAIFKEFEEIGHGGLAVLKPETFAEEIIKLCKDKKES